jgi:hypothetical protein
MRAILYNKIISNARRYWPMHIVEGDASSGFRIGGVPPAGAKPEQANERTRYFGTFPISGGRDGELSIFTSFDYTNSASAVFVTRNINRPLDGNSEVIQCVFHKPSERGGDPRLASDLNDYSVAIGPELLDNIEDEKGGVPHKVGGIPFLYPKYRDISDHLLDEGYCHLLQWAFPGKGDCVVRGAWPFHNYMFHLYIKDCGHNYKYKALLL